MGLSSGIISGDKDLGMGIASALAAGEPLGYGK